VLPTFSNPPNVGNNGHWIANNTMSLDSFDDVKLIKFCFYGSGAVSSLHYRDVGCTTASPTPVPTAKPATATPSTSPTNKPSTPSPTASPSASPISPTSIATVSPSTCPIDNTMCDFSTLLPGVAMSNAAQAQRLLQDCKMSVTATNTTSNNLVNVFNSSKILGNMSQFDPDLGSPNALCPGGGPGRGVGGRPSAPFRK
jgi:hypothetical protein